jgi:hypothetical protein
MAKNIIYTILWLTLVGLFFELSCWGYFSFYYVTPVNNSVDEDLASLIKAIPQEDLDGFRRGQFDPRLGWNNGPDVSYEHLGALYVTNKDRVRVNPYQSSTVRISAYGDSFTFGDEVENNETFPFYLSQITDSDVINYGVSAYGTDQALKRLEENLNNGKRTDFVILEFIQDSIQRNMNMYLSFKYGFEDWTRYMFKPMLYGGPDGYEWVENPLKSAENTNDILNAYEASKEYDWFYKHPHQDISFPYTVSAFKTLLFLSKQKYEGTTDWGWGNEASEEKMEELINFYSALSKEHDFVPVIIYIPLGFEIKDYFSNDEEYRFNKFLEKISEDYIDTNMIVIDLAKELKSIRKELLIEQFYVKSYDGHPSAYGNKIIADVIHKRINGARLN